MEESVTDFHRRVPSKGRRHAEKDLWAQFAYIILSKPNQTIPLLVKQLGSPKAQQLHGRLDGTWHAYRVSTIHRDRGKGEPRCFPGCAGKGGIADVKGGIPDVLLLLNPDYSRGKQVTADLFLYFELKSSDDRSRLTASQLNRYLAALSSEIPARGFLGAIGGPRPPIRSHSQWLGHITLTEFFELAADFVVSTSLADEIRALQKKLQAKD